MTTLDAFLKELEDSLTNSNPGDIAPDTEFRKLKWWDSLATLILMATVDGCFNQQLSAPEIAGCKTFKDVFELAKSKCG
jgi:acyl carrier protein